MKLRLKLLAGALVIGMPMAAHAQDATAAPDTAQPDATPPEATPPEATPPAATEAPATTQQPATTPPADAAAQPAPSQAQTAATKKAAKEDLKVDVAVVDPKGGAVGKIEKVTANGAVVATGDARVELALDSFGVGDKGLVIGMTKAELEAAAKSKAPDTAKEEKPKDKK